MKKLVIWAFAWGLMLWPAAGSAGAIVIRLDVDDMSYTYKSPARTEHGLNTNFFRSPERLDDPRVWRMVSELHIPLIRFPGGMGNWYNWQTGMIEVQGRQIFKFMEKGDFRRVPMAEAINIAKENHLGVVYVLNILDSGGKIQALAEMWKSLGTAISGVELGSELYTENLAAEIGGIAGYLRRSRMALKALRKGGYDGPVGVVLAPEWTPGKEKHVHRRQWISWNEALEGDTLNEFDAVIGHYYPLVRKLGFRDAANAAGPGLSKMVNKVRERFPGKNIWITEWNLGQPATDEGFGTLEHGLFVMDMLQVMDREGVSLSCYHVLTGRAWELLGPDRFVLDHIPGDKAKLVPRIPYYSFYMYMKASEGRIIYNGSRDGAKIMMFENESSVDVLLWSKKKMPFKVELISDKNAYNFSEGILFKGALEASNGTLLGYLGKGRKPLKIANIKPGEVDKPYLDGPGIALFHFVEANSEK